jgi:hypothetical protein
MAEDQRRRSASFMVGVGLERLRSWVWLWKPLVVRASLAVGLVLLACSAGIARAQQSPVESVEGPLPETGPKALTNDTIIKLVKAGLSDDLILQTIAAQPGQYSTDADSLLKLKDAGVSDKVITGMINKSRRKLTPVPEESAATTTVATETPITLSPVNEIGLYYKDHNGKWIQMDSELVHIESGGFIKSTATRGIIKPDQNGRVNGPTSKLTLVPPIEFLIYTPDGADSDEYDLVRFRLHSDRREFRILTGGIIHSTGGADRDEVPFHPTKIAPRTYEFSVESKVGGGQYGILPPGSGNRTNGGKIYTFGIVVEGPKSAK